MKLRKLGNNQTVIETNDFDILISYETPVAAHDKKSGEWYYTSKKWSATTERHIKSWLLPHAHGAQRDQSFFDELLNTENA